MSFKSREEASGAKDLNSVFDDVGVDKQSETIRLAAYEEGREAGRKSGYEQGFDFGMKMIAAYGAELGYSSFLAKHWKTKLQHRNTETSDGSTSNVRQNPAASNNKSHVLDQLIELCDSAPRHNDPDIEFNKIVQRLQIKFKHANSLVGDRKQFNGPNFLSSSAPDNDSSMPTCSSISATKLDF